MICSRLRNQIGELGSLQKVLLPTGGVSLVAGGIVVSASALLDDASAARGAVQCSAIGCG